MTEEHSNMHEGGIENILYLVKSKNTTKFLSLTSMVLSTILKDS